MRSRTALGLAALLSSAAAAYGCGSSSSTSGAGGATASMSSSSKASSSTKATVSSSAAGGAGGGGGGFGGDLAFTPCNPVLGCGGAFDCDLAGTDFECFFADGSDATACGACDESNGKFCKDGYGCLPSGACSRFCCDDGDCGTGNTCDLTLYVDLGDLTDMHGVGVCRLGQTPDGGAGGAGGASASTSGGGGAGGGGPFSDLKCAPNAPAVSPSMGTCWTM